MNKPLVENGPDWELKVGRLYANDRCEFWRIYFDGKWPETVVHRDEKGSTLTVIFKGDTMLRAYKDASRVTFFDVPESAVTLVQTMKREILVAILRA